MDDGPQRKKMNTDEDRIFAFTEELLSGLEEHFAYPLNACTNGVCSRVLDTRKLGISRFFDDRKPEIRLTSFYLREEHYRLVVQISESVLILRKDASFFMLFVTYRSAFDNLRLEIQIPYIFFRQMSAIILSSELSIGKPRRWEVVSDLLGIILESETSSLTQ